MRIVRLISLAGVCLFLSQASLGGPQNAAGALDGRPAPSADDQRIEKLNAVARFCAGLEVDRQSELFNLTESQEWTAFAAKEKSRWVEFDKSARKIRAWAESEISRQKLDRSTLFYPFGGPDILYADLLMPSAKLYVLIGLESVGSFPDVGTIGRGPLDEFLAQYSLALDDITRLSFFRRADLKEELKSSAIDGVLPVFMVLLARMDKELVAVERGRLDRQGEFFSTEEDAGRIPRALRIRFRDRKHKAERTLLYLSQDLSNPAVDSNRAFLALADKNLTHCFTFIKSASYLMHKMTFSSIREMILKLSDVVLQDDSGISFKFFDPQVWTVNLYGSYAGPIELFKEYFEQDLFDAYQAGAKPLGFRIGYGRKSHLLLAVKKAF
jgi:hypothetical protein